MKPGGLLCCSNLESASEETYLLLGNVALALLTLEAAKLHGFNAVYTLVPVPLLQVLHRSKKNKKAARRCLDFV